MKTTGKLKFVFGMALLAVLSMTLSSFSVKQPLKNKTSKIYLNAVNVNITINSTTTQQEFEDIMDMLKEHDIQGSFTNIKRNDNGEITAIKIELKDLASGSKSSSNLKGTSPIGEMMDSLQTSFFNFNDEEGNAFMFNGHSMNMDEMMSNMQSMMGNMDDMMGSMTDMFSIEEDENGDKRITIKGGNNLNFLFNNDESNSSKANKTQKFKFYDDPNSEKIIIIDGKESSFEVLDALAKSDKLDSVDVLKGKTAVSIYGQKAKDGAIIAITK